MSSGVRRQELPGSRHFGVYLRAFGVVVNVLHAGPGKHELRIATGENSTHETLHDPERVLEAVPPRDLHDQRCCGIDRLGLEHQRSVADARNLAVEPTVSVARHRRNDPGGAENPVDRACLKHAVLV